MKLLLKMYQTLFGSKNNLVKNARANKEKLAQATIIYFKLNNLIPTLPVTQTNLFKIMKNILHFKKATSMLFWIFALLFLQLSGKVYGQVNMASSGSHAQNFNVLTTSGTWSNSSTIANWYSQRTGTGSAYVIDHGNLNSGGLYSYGTTSAADRSLGSLGSGTAGNFAHGVLLRNTSGSSITDIKVSYTLEQWRNSAAAAQSITFYYKISSSTVTSLNTNNNSGLTQVTGLTLSSPIIGGTAGAIDGNATANKVAVSNISIPSLSLANNNYIMLKWEDPDHSGNDHGLSIDDVTISWTVAAAVTTAPTAPTITSITPSNGQLSVAFTAPSSNGGAAISNYQYSTDGGTNY
jgi:hypothetical protein